jgi:pimeloyl-ACP methyl ester carboxylesterase
MEVFTRNFTRSFFMNWLFGKIDKYFLLAGVISILFAAGCSTEPFDTNNQYTTSSRVDSGLVVILPGIEGESGANHDIRAGLYKAGLPYALVIYRWGVPGLGGMLVNQTDVERNRSSARELAGYIASYQANHPGKPVFIIGHSAGGGIAVFALESLDRVSGGQPVTGVFLLSASISSSYNLVPALRMTQRGLVNVSNSGDNLLNGGTATFGNVDGGRGDSAGRTGFYRSYSKVFERPITNEGVWKKEGILSAPHFLATKEQLIEKYAPAWILSPSWPPARPGTNPLK